MKKKKKASRKKPATKKRIGRPPNKKPKARRNAPKRRVSTKKLEEQDVEFEALLGELMPKQKEFLIAYYEKSTIAEAAREIGVSRQAHHDVWMKKDETGNYVYALYAQMFQDARAALVEIAEAELWRRGVKGIDEPLTHQGTLTGGVVRKYDTTALIFWLKGNCASKYRERFEHTGADGGPMSMTVDVARQIADNFDKNERENE